EDAPQANAEEKVIPSITVEKETAVATPVLEDDTPRRSTDSSLPLDSLMPTSSTTTTAPLENGTVAQSTEDLLQTISQLRADLFLCESRRAEENQASSERIDSLEEKIKYLARESAEDARRRITSS